MEALINQGAAIDSGAQVEQMESAGIVAPPTGDNAAMEWLIVPQMLSFVITTIFPETKENYTLENNMELARAIVPVAEKYGWTGVGESPELMLGVAALGFSMPAILAYKTRKEAKASAINQPEIQKDGAINGSSE